MFKLKSLTFLGLLVTISFQVLAQKSYKDLKSDANEFFRIEEYHHALPLYLKMDSIKPDVPETNYHIGVCYYNTEYKLKALPYFIKAKKLMHKHHELDLMLGRLYHLHHDFDKAIEHYNHHRRYVNEKSQDGREGIKEIERLIAQCELARKLVAKPLDYEITNLGPNINSKFSDYAPVISADETMLIFTSKRNTTTGGGYDELNDCYYEDVYISTKQDGNWSQAVDIGSPINTNGHDACIGLSPDGQKLFVYRSTKKDAEDIFVSDLKGEKWGELYKLNNNINTTYWESHASITADEQTLYFTSNKPGGKGKKDIYVSKRKADGDWGPAEDLSSKINTEYDEDCPFIHPDGKTLYFSSTGHNSMGGYDIFKTVYNEETKEWSEPENIGYPINTADDDLFLVWSADGSRAYFSSIRADTYGEKDIYLAKKKEISNYVVVLKGNVKDKKTNKPLAAVITVNNLSTGDMVGVYNSNSATGKFVVVLPVGKDFSVTVDAPGYVFHSEHINVEEPDRFMEVEKSIALEPVGMKDQVEVLNNVFFDYDKSALRPQSKTELDRLANLLKNNKELYVEIAAHTDSVANNVYNLKLSNDRAKSVVNYLVSQGIDSTRLLAAGYGEDFPVASNKTSEGRQMNRRSEFIFVEKFSSQNRSQKLLNSFYYRKEREELDKFKAAKEETALKNFSDNQSNSIILVHDSKYKVRLYIPGKKPSLTDTTAIDLKNFVTLLKANNAPIIVSAHTDRHSTESQELMKKRMESVAKYLASQGLPAANITTKFVGDKKPYVTLVQGESHKLNQRIEILINIRNLDE